MPIQTAKTNASLLGLAIVMMGLFACNNSTPDAEKKSSPDSSTVKTEAAKTYDVAVLDNKKDPTCGMPVSAGISDTVHYKDKVIGFCSAECKAEFAKNPEAGLVAAELKK